MAALPNTILVGAAKAGTTSLCRDLEKHPDIYMYPSKETHFFSFNYAMGIDHYRSLFHPTGQKIVMEASPEYSARGKTRLTVERMLKHLPGARVIYMTRSPLKRLESEYVQELANGRKPLSFEQAVFDWNLLDGSLYEKNYQIFAEAFSPENVHVVFFEDYLVNKAETLSALLRFLDVKDDPAVYADREPVNTRREQIVDPPLMKKLRGVRSFERLKPLVPDSLKFMLKKSISQEVKAEIVWNDALLERVMPKIRDDAEVFLKRYEKPMALWF